MLSSQQFDRTRRLALIETFRRGDPPVSILAMDVDVEALAVAGDERSHQTDRDSIGLDLAARFKFLTRS